MDAELKKNGCAVSAAGCDPALALPSKDHWSCAAKSANCYSPRDGMCSGSKDKKLVLTGQHLTCKKAH